LYRRLNRGDLCEKVAQNRNKNTGNELRKAGKLGKLPEGKMSCEYSMNSQLMPAW
jgi:hypothetical protein